MWRLQFNLIRRAAGVVVVLFAGIIGAAHAEEAERVSPRVDAFMVAEMARQKVPGAAVGVVQKGQEIIVKGYGMANAELNVPVSRETLFESGSLGKQFTATAVMLQVEDGKLALDDSITKYFVDAPQTWRPITVRHLLTHTSGIPDYEAENNSADTKTKSIDYRRDYTEVELTQIAYRMPLNFAPGTRWSYSNTGYVLLGILIHKVSGQFYGDVLKSRVFAPLGMKTARIISEADIVPDRASGYQLVKGILKNQDWVSPSLNTTADGSLYLSILDYLAWDRGLRGHEVLKPQSWSHVYAPVTLRSGNSYPYGFGWEVDDWQGQPWYHHGGAWQGFKTYISRYLADDLTIVVLTNLADAVPEQFVDGVARIVDPKIPALVPVTRIPDQDSSTTARARTLLVTLARGGVASSEIGFAQPLLAAQASQFEEQLKPLGTLLRLDLLDRRALGDDQQSIYEAVYADQRIRVRVDVGPDGRIYDFGLGDE